MTEQQRGVSQLLQDYRPQICALGYISEPDNPVVCTMGFALWEQYLILHTSTWMYKWRRLSDGQKVSLAIGQDHLDHYAQVFGCIRKVPLDDPHFSYLENIYMKSHPDAQHYRKGEEGIILVEARTVRIGNVVNRKVTFEEYHYEPAESLL
jgi:hypothetical protein